MTTTPREARAVGSLARTLPWVLLFCVPLVWAAGGLWDKQSVATVTWQNLVWALGFLAFPVVGSVLAHKLPRNAIGWLMLSGPLLIGAGISLSEYSEASGAAIATTISENLLGVGLVVLGSALLIFPDGRYPRRWFKWAHLTLLAALVGIPSDAVDGVAMALLIGLALAALTWRVVEGDGATRRQMAPPLIVGLVGATFLFVTNAFFSAAEHEWLGIAAVLSLTVGIPTAIAISVTRYRLYDFDRFLSRTVTYAIVVALLTGAVALLAAVVGTLFESPLVVATTTLGVAAAFNPLRRRIQRVVDHRFNRSKYDAERVMDRFGGSLRDETDADVVMEGWMGVVSETMRPSSIGIWLR
jgi:hypothetical protein